MEKKVEGGGGLRFSVGASVECNVSGARVRADLGGAHLDVRAEGVERLPQRVHLVQYFANVEICQFL